jgi:D-beta-D-heptose 7-phosphate kinase/D-beta-D-heptose 1-phosphate adenosyltransferase
MKTNVFDVLNQHSTVEQRYIPDPHDLKELVDFYKSQGKKIIMTGGSWDLLHIGHVRYLRKAREMGHLLIVGVDGDDIVKKDKGKNRPIVSEDERIELVGELRVSDIVTKYSTEENRGPEYFIRLIQPDILVMSTTTDKNKGGEFAKKWQKAYEGICEVHVLEAQATTSTSARVAQLVKDGGRELAEKIIHIIREAIGTEEFGEFSNGDESKKGGKK